MKRWMSLILLLSLVIAGCTTKAEVAEWKKTQLVRAEGQIYDEDLITVGFIQTGKESDWRDANTNDFLNTFTAEKGYKLIYVDGNSDPKRQVKAAYDLIVQQVDYLIIDPIVETGWDDVLIAAQEKGIPVIISDRQVNANAAYYTSWIGSDFYEEGVRAAEWLERYLVEQNRQEEEIKIVILEGTKGATAALGRSEGLNQEIERHPNWKVISRECGNFTQGEGMKVMQVILEKDIEFDVLISENDNMMFGAMKAMDEIDMDYGVGTDVITISFDALKEAFSRMIFGDLMVSVECNPLIAGLCEEVVLQLEKGERVEKVNFIEEDVFTYENAAQHILERKY